MVWRQGGHVGADLQRTVVLPGQREVAEPLDRPGGGGVAAPVGRPEAEAAGELDRRHLEARRILPQPGGEPTERKRGCRPQDGQPVPLDVRAGGVVPADGQLRLPPGLDPQDGLRGGVRVVSSGAIECHGSSHL